MKIEKLKVGQVIYDVQKNTSMANWKLNVYPVTILGIDLTSRSLTISYNNNPAREVHESQWKKYRYKEPENAPKWKI